MLESFVWSVSNCLEWNQRFLVKMVSATNQEIYQLFRVAGCCFGKVGGGFGPPDCSLRGYGFEFLIFLTELLKS